MANGGYYSFLLFTRLTGATASTNGLAKMEEYEAIFKCPWCGDIPITDEDFRNRIIGDTIGLCPKCERMSYASSIKAKMHVNGKEWRGTYGSAE